jgi:hypothetical protein
MPSLYEAQYRHAKFYLEVLRSARDLYKEGDENVRQALIQFDQNWGQIEKGQLWASTYTKETSEAAELCNVYPLRAGALLRLRRDSRQRIEWHEAALAAARRLGNAQTEGKHLNNLSIAHSAIGEIQRAIDYHKQSLKLK